MSTKSDQHPFAREGFHVRPATLDDVDELLLLYNAYWMAMTGATNFTRAHLERVFTTPDFDLTSSTRVVISPHSAIIGSAFLEDLTSPPVHPNVYGCVHADFQRQGIGTWLVRWAEERGRQVFSRVPDGTRVSLCFYTSSSHEPTRCLFEKLGLNAIRYSWLMLIELVEPPPAPTWPTGIHLCTFRDYPHLGAVLQATDQAFQDSWGHVEVEDEEQRLRRWQHLIKNDEGFDPSLWFLALDGEEIAAVARCSPRLKADPTGGEVVVLGVRRPWRRRGLGLSLLRHAFCEFHRRGYRKVGLVVDADSLTGATRLYEKAGMHVAREFILYEKELRPGVELWTQALED